MSHSKYTMVAYDRSQPDLKSMLNLKQHW